MPLDYAIETDVKPIIRDFRTGAVLDPGGAGDKYVVDHRGKRVPYEILPDSTPSPKPKRARVKSEPAPYDRLQTVNIKSEDEMEGPNRTSMAGPRDPRRGSSSRRHAATATAPSRPRSPCLSTRGGDRKAQARDSPSDDDEDSSNDTGSSSSGSSLSDDSSSDDSSSEDSNSDGSDSSSSLDGSVTDLSSVFRPSKSPSRFADTPSPTTRSHSRAKKDDYSDSDSEAPPTPSPPSKKKKKGKQPAQATSIQRPTPLSFYIPIRRTGCQDRPSSPAFDCVESTISLASSCGHGGKAIGKPGKASKSSKLGKKSGVNQPGPKDVRSVSMTPAAVASSQQYRAATAGPSTGIPKTASLEKSSLHSSQKVTQSQIVQPSPQSQSSSACRSPKGKEIATAPNENKADCQDKKRLANKEKWKKLRDKTKAKKKMLQLQLQQQQQEEMNSQANASTRRGPPRQARIERSIETPGPGLPTPGPSSSVANVHANSLSNHSPARSESGMFVTSPVQPPTTPGQSSHRTPPVSLSPMHSSPPTVIQNKKRSRSVYEDAVESGIRSLNKAAKRSEHMTQKIETEMRLVRERLEEKMDEERTERQLLERHWEERFVRVRNDDRTERERVALELDGKLCRDTQKNEVERKRIEQDLAENEMRLTTLQDQVQSQSDRMKSRLDTQASQLSDHQGELDGQRARQQTILTRLERLEMYARNQDELKKRLDEFERQVKISQQCNNDKLQSLEAASWRAGPAATNQQGLAQARSFGGRNPQIREVRQREAYDWDMHGRKPGVLSDTLIQSEHGKPNPRTLPPRPPRTPGGSLSSSSFSRPVHPIARNNASHPNRPNESAMKQNRSSQKPVSRSWSSSSSSSSRLAQPKAQNGNASISNKPNEGALQQYSSSNIRPAINTNSASRERSEPSPSPVRPGPSTTHTPAEPRAQPTSSPVQRALVQSPPEIDSQPAPATPSSPPTAAAAASEPNSLPRRLPRVTHQEMKARVLNYPLSELEFTIGYDENTDRGPTSAATVFLLNVPQLDVENRFRDFINRDAFAFDLDDPFVRAKGCWAVQARGQQDTQFKLYYDERNYSFTLNRVAVRLWHGIDSVNRLLLSKDHMAVRLCHQIRCFNPEHIVVEDHNEQKDRSKCLRDGLCYGHRVWSKCGPTTERRRCIL